MPWSKTS